MNPIVYSFGSYLQVIQADGGTRCACLNAAFLALADAGIAMRDMVASCAAGYLDSTSLLDLNYLEDCGGGPDIAVALHPKLDKVVLLQADNRLGVETFEEVMELAMAGCRAVGQFMREILMEHVRFRAGVRQLKSSGGGAALGGGDAEAGGGESGF